MSKVAGHIIKANDVKLQGQFYLDVAQLQPSPKKKNAVSTAQQAHIVESHPEFAVIEVTCCCGKKIYLKCEYAGVNATEQVPDKTK